MVAGIILGAVGNEMLLAHPTGHIDLATTLIVVGGPALFLAGSLWFYWLFCGEPPMSHMIGLLALGALGVLAPLAAPVWLGAATSLVVIAVGAWETFGYPRPHVTGQEHG